jgi:hypothetical protein
VHPGTRPRKPLIEGKETRKARARGLEGTRAPSRLEAMIEGQP